MPGPCVRSDSSADVGQEPEQRQGEVRAVERREMLDIEDHKASVRHCSDKPLGHRIAVVAASEHQQNRNLQGVSRGPEVRSGGLGPDGTGERQRPCGA